MKEIIERLLNDYVTAKYQPFANNPLGKFIKNEAPEMIYDTGIVDSSSYLVKGSTGQGNWANVPWVAVFDPRIAQGAKEGVYIVYLLAENGNSLYLTLNQGCTTLVKGHGTSEAKKIMQKRAEEIKSRIDLRTFDASGDIFLGNSSPAQLYKAGTICYKEYKRMTPYSEDEIQNDLKEMVAVYHEYATIIGLDPESTQKAWLLTWNPKKWNWEDYEEAVSMTQNGQECKIEWSCSSKNINTGDRVFLTVLGSGDKNGIIASGTALSEPDKDDPQDPNDKTRWIDVSFDCILDYRSQKTLKQSELKSLFPLQHWSPQGSGIAIKPEYVNQLEEEWEKVKTGVEPLLSVRETIQRINEYIRSKGFNYQDGLIENFYLCLKSKPFVILAGTSGTGKTRLVKLFAEAIGATTDNGQYKMVSVRPDWSDSSDLFGHTNLNGEFVHGAIIDFVKRAEQDKEHPYFLCLDEMNLARVEYYLSDILSVIETREMTEDGRIHSDPLVSSDIFGTDTIAKQEFGEVQLPDNLYIVGTVNMDETTFPFSKKVLDRANTIEFSDVNLVPDFSETTSDSRVLSLPNDFLKARYLVLKRDCAADVEYVTVICKKLQKINAILAEYDANVGYRVRDEIVFYMLNNRENDLLPEDAAMDNEIMQKILPRIQGGSGAIFDMLKSLFICLVECQVNDLQNSAGDRLCDKMLTYTKNHADGLQYPRSTKKIMYMTRRYEEDGFTSYWL